VTRRAHSGGARIAVAVALWGALGLAVGCSRDNCKVGEGRYAAGGHPLSWLRRTALWTDHVDRPRVNPQARSSAIETTVSNPDDA
jgi:hypothetical protein